MILSVDVGGLGDRRIYVRRDVEGVDNCRYDGMIGRIDGARCCDMEGMAGGMARDVIVGSDYRGLSWEEDVVVEVRNIGLDEWVVVVGEGIGDSSAR